MANNMGEKGVELTVKSSASSAKTAIDRLIGKIKELQGTLESIAPVFTTIQNATQGIRAIGKISMKGLTGQLERISKLDMSAMSESFGRLTTAVTPFIDKVNSGETSLVALGTTIKAVTAASAASVKTVTNETEKLATTANKAAPSLKKLFSIGKLYVAINYGRRYAKTFASMLSYSINFNETLNLFQVSMGKLSDRAMQFNQRLSSAFGLSQESLLKMQGTFNNMLKGLGNLNTEVAYGLSESLTQMVIDYSSLFNKSIETSAQAFESMLSGQIRPIRTGTGIDTSEITKYQEYLSLGGTKTMRQLNQTEKRLLGILTVAKQLNTMGAEGDWAKTIEQPANQLKIMQEQVKELFRWVGSIVMVWAKNEQILQKINAAIMVASELAKSLAIVMGFEIEDFSLPDIKDPLKDYENQVEETVDKIRGLFSFDKFEVLQTGGGAANQDLIDPSILAALQEYKSDMENVKLRARELADGWLKILGFEKNADTGLLEIIGGLDFADTKLGKIIDTVKALFSTIAGFMIVNKIANIIKGFDGIKAAIKAALGHSLLSIFAATLIYAYTTNEEFRESVNNLVKSLQPLFTVLTQIVNTLMPFIKALVNIIAQIVIAAEKTGILYGVIYGVIAALVILQGIKIVSWAASGIEALGKLIGKLTATKTALWEVQGASLATKLAFVGIGVAAGVLLAEVLKELPANVRLVIGAMLTLVGVVTAAAIALGALQSAWSLGIAAAAIVAGVLSITSAIKSSVPDVPKAAMGGAFSKGQMFIAREAGPELVGAVGNTSAVVNNDQIVEAVSAGVYRAVVDAMSVSGGAVTIVVDGRNLNNSVIGRELVNALQTESGRRGTTK
jgi:hypothetical protein